MLTSSAVDETLFSSPHSSSYFVCLIDGHFLNTQSYWLCCTLVRRINTIINDRKNGCHSCVFETLILLFQRCRIVFSREATHPDTIRSFPEIGRPLGRRVFCFSLRLRSTCLTCYIVRCFSGCISWWCRNARSCLSWWSGWRTRTGGRGSCCWRVLGWGCWRRLYWCCLCIGGWCRIGHLLSQCICLLVTLRTCGGLISLIPISQVLLFPVLFSEKLLSDLINTSSYITDEFFDGFFSVWYHFTPSSINRSRW